MTPTDGSTAPAVEHPEDAVLLERHTGPGKGPGRLARISWGIIDQAASSLTNLGLAVLVGRAVSAAEFGRFSAVVLVYQLVNGLLRGAVSEPVVVVHGNATRRASERDLDRSLGAAVGLGLASGLVIALGAIAFTSGSTRSQFLVLAVTMAGLQLQDAVRYCAITLRLARAAAINDILWGVLFAGAAAFIISGGADTALPYVTAWCVSGTIAGVIGLLQLRLWPDPGMIPFLRMHRKLAGAYAFEATAQRGAPRLASIAAGFSAGINEFAGLRGALLFSNQLVVLSQAARLVAVPEGVRGRDLRDIKRVAYVTMGLLAAVTFVFGAALLLVPDSIGRQLLGDTWRYAEPVLPYVMLRQFFNVLSMGPEIILRSLAQATASFRGRLANSVLLIAFGTIGAIVGGAIGCAVGMAIAELISAVIWFAVSHVAMREGRRL